MAGSVAIKARLQTPNLSKLDTLDKQQDAEFYANEKFFDLSWTK